MYPTADDAPSAARQAACRCVTVRAAPRARAVITAQALRLTPGRRRRRALAACFFPASKCVVGVDWLSVVVM